MKNVVPVKYLDRTSKASMIHDVLSFHKGQVISPGKLLDIGCGNGDICRFFCQRGFSVFGVDVEDCRRPNNKNFDFFLVNTEAIPISDDFAYIISNQVIEHLNDQNKHLEEIKRLLEPDGLVYFSTPNKTSPLMQGHKGNKQVLRWGQVRRLLRQHGFYFYDYGLEVAKNPKKYNCEPSWGDKLPYFLLKSVRLLFPSHIFVLRKSKGTVDSHA